MTREELTQQYKKAHKVYEDFGLKATSSADLKALILYELWRDGADWGTLTEMMDDLPYDDEKIRDHLVNVFGYKED